MISNMLLDFEDYPAEFEFSYDDLCTGFYDKLNLPPYDFYDDQDEMHGVAGIPSTAHLLEYEGTGDSADMFPEIEEPQEPQPFENDEIAAKNFHDANHAEIEYSEINCNPPPIIDNQRQDLRLRYTRKYLLNCSRSPLSTAFPDCLLKYLYSDEVPIKREQEVQRNHRSMDHILFYTALPYTRTKHSLGSSVKKTTT